MQSSNNFLGSVVTEYSLSMLKNAPSLGLGIEPPSLLRCKRNLYSHLSDLLSDLTFSTKVQSAFSL